MGKGIFVIGTDTDVGKTFVTGGLVYKLRERGYNAIAFKPIQSGGILEENDKLIPPDIKYVKEVCDINNNYYEMNTYCLKEEVSPHLAAKIENLDISKKKIINQYNNLISKYDYVVVEGAGGIVVPLIEDKYFVYDLIKDLNLDVVIVASAGVGTINHTVLTNEFLKQNNINSKGIIINGYNDKFYEKDNIQMIEKLTNLKVIQTIRNIKKPNINNIKNEYRSLCLEKILNIFN
ncbi:dethiobiotin synthase [Clostridium sp. CCUG 7971]|uniref:dethiobiotin synthase n=1 Tax=Clostridium sp. CCUG 7971 TaxID=2811414 RepID=UPI001ABBCDF8|nr:dethiobiotin synthase [Clostridium sp. CCUG 7971]MBO3445981.1 dethiobiotin synthase [Clostridium sp. CCUG 7971]